MDRNHNGKIDTGAELFGNYTPGKNGKTTANGFEALKTYKDLVSAPSSCARAVASELLAPAEVTDYLCDGDADAADLRFWCDANANGVTDKGELVTLADRRVAAVSIKYDPYHCQTYFGDGKRYDPATNKWLPMSMDNAPDPRRVHTAVWTGTRMLVWGGQYRQEYLENGASYDPETDKWTPMASIAPRGRAGHVAVWSGKRMLVWGGVTGIEQYEAPKVEGKGMMIPIRPGH